MLGLLKLDRDGQLPYVLLQQWVKVKIVMNGENPLEVIRRRERRDKIVFCVGLSFLASFFGSLAASSVLWFSLSQFVLFFACMIECLGNWLRMLNGEDKTGFADDLEEFDTIAARPFHILASMGLKELQELAENVLFDQAAKVLEIQESQNKHELGSPASRLLEAERIRLKGEFTRKHNLFYGDFGLVEQMTDRFFEKEPSDETERVIDSVRRINSA